MLSYYNQNFQSHVESTFMYNHELWTVIKKLEKIINSCQRNITCKILHTMWGDEISNGAMYEGRRVMLEQTLKKRRLTCHEHLLHLPEETLTKNAFEEDQKQ